MIRLPVKLPRLPMDFIFTAAALLLALAAGRALLVATAPGDLWLDVLFLGSVILFLLSVIRFLVHAFDFEPDLDEIQTAQQRSPRETDAARK